MKSLQIFQALLILFCFSCRNNQFVGTPNENSQRSNSQKGVDTEISPDTTLIDHPVEDHPVDDPVPSNCSGVLLGGYCWYSAGQSESCLDFCQSRGGYNEATRTFVGYPGGSPDNCKAVHDALKTPGDRVNVGNDADMKSASNGNYCFDARSINLVSSSGCVNNYSPYWKGARIYCRKKSGTTAAASSTYLRRVCACQK